MERPNRFSLLINGLDNSAQRLDRSVHLHWGEAGKEWVMAVRNEETGEVLRREPCHSQGDDLSPLERHRKK